MAFPKAKELDRRVPLYSYARPVIEGRRVLELGTGPGHGAEHLLDLGAAEVVSADERPVSRVTRPGIKFVAGMSSGALERYAPFDLIVVPEARALLSRLGPFSLSTLRAWLTPHGRLLCAAGSAEAFGPASGIDYYDMLDALSPHFSVVRMFGQTPFWALGIAEFDALGAGLRVDAGLIDPDSEAPTHYVALAGSDEGPVLGYALVQVPIGMPLGPPGSDVILSPPPPVAVVPAPIAVAKPASIGAAGAAELDDLRKRIADLTDEKERQIRELARKLVEVEGRADGVVRVSRAQAEELEELRARLRRAAEVRAELDEEIARMRRALTEADESVINLTRRTADEMSALAHQLTSGLRPALSERREPAGEASALLEQLKQRDAALATRESALFERDERIVALEIERQDLMWRLDAPSPSPAGRASDPAVRAAPAVAREDATGSRAPGSQSISAVERELRETLAQRDQASREFQRAAIVHMREVERARAAAAEQAAQVTELQEALAAAEARADAATREAERLRVVVAETQDADRTRRSRLAELEGKLLRLQREAQGLEQQPGGPDVGRLREALDQSDDQLRAARSQVLPLRGRIADLERERAARAQADRTFFSQLSIEVGALEIGLRHELVELDALIGKIRQGQGASV